MNILKKNVGSTTPGPTGAAGPGLLVSAAENSWWLAKKARPFEVALPPIGTYLTIGCVGDSMAPQVASPLTYELLNRYGLGGIGSLWISGAMMNEAETIYPTLTNTVQIDDLMYSPCGAIYNVSSGGNISFAQSTNSTTRNKWRKVTAYIGLKSSGGTAKVEVIQNGSVVATKTLATAGAAGMAKVEIINSDGLLSGAKPTVKVTASGGSVYVLGVMYWRDRGVVPFAMGRSGYSLALQNTTPTTSLDFWNTEFAPALMIHQMLEEDATGTNADIHIGRFVTAFPSTTQLIISTNPTNSTTPLNSAGWKVVADKYGCAFIDGYKMLKDYTILTALGWNGDGIHLNSEAYRYVLHCYMTALPALSISQKSRDFRNAAIARYTIATCQRSHLITPLNKSQVNGASVSDAGAGVFPLAKATFATSSAGASSASAIIACPSTYGNSIDKSASYTLIYKTLRQSIAANLSAWLQMGLGFSTKATFDKTVEGVGIEFAYPEDVGLTGGANGTLAVRLWGRSTAGLVEGPWVTYGTFLGSSQVMWILKYEAGLLSLSAGADLDSSITELTSIPFTSTANFAQTVHAGYAVTGAQTVAFLCVSDVLFFPQNQVQLASPWVI